MCRNSCFLILMAVAILSSLPGCSEPPTRFPVAGTVLIDGKPLTSGSIQFVPANGRPVVGKISSDGSFRLVNLSVTENSTSPGVGKGSYKVAISSSVVIDEDNGEMHFNIPKHYADFRTSELEAEITGPQEDMVIELTWEGFEESEESASAEADADVDGDADGEASAEAEAQADGEENTDESAPESGALTGESGESAEE